MNIYTILDSRVSRKQVIEIIYFNYTDYLTVHNIDSRLKIRFVLEKFFTSKAKFDDYINLYIRNMKYKQLKLFFGTKYPFEFMCCEFVIVIWSWKKKILNWVLRFQIYNLMFCAQMYCPYLCENLF